jgi:hypothetical protein
LTGWENERYRNGASSHWGGRAVTETNPTMTEFAELVAEEKAALLAVIDVADDTPEAAQARTRLHEARAAILAARPSDRKVMGMQMQWWLKERQDGSLYPDDQGMLEHIAEQLGAIGPAAAWSARALIGSVARLRGYEVGIHQWTATGCCTPGSWC